MLPLRAAPAWSSYLKEESLGARFRCRRGSATFNHGRGKLCPLAPQRKAWSAASTATVTVVVTHTLDRASLCGGHRVTGALTQGHERGSALSPREGGLTELRQ